MSRKKKREQQKTAKENLSFDDRNSTRRGSAKSSFTQVATAPVSLWSFSILAILITALALRSIGLDLKPPHFDEGINGFFVQKVWREGFYRYDPSNFHGPLYFYFLTFAELLFGRSIVGYRLINGLISLACVAVVAKHKRFFGTSAIWAALFMAISTAFVFYSRYAIHESLFIYFQLLFSYGYFLWCEDRSRRSLAMMACGFFASIMIKETFFIFFLTWAIAVFCVRLLNPQRSEPLQRGADAGFWHQPAGFQDGMNAASIGLFSLILLFTGFFINPSGFVDMFRAYVLWTKTGTANSGHEKPFFYWIDLLWRYEWPALVALFGSLPLFYFFDSRRRLIALFSFGVWLSYSLIPYKTPWLILNLLWPLAFVFGFLFEELKRIPQWWGRAAARIVLLSTLAVDGQTMIRLNFRDFALSTEPYVYVQSTNQMKYVIDFIQQRVQKFPEELNMKVLVLVRDPWPLPWLFNSFPRLTYGAPETIELDDAGVIMIDGLKQKVLEDRMKARFYRLRFQIRDSYEGGFCYLAYDKFQGLVPADSDVVGPAVGPASGSKEVPK